MNERIVLSDFEVSYGRSGTILAVPHLELEPGRITAVTGRSGEGKSTLGHALAGLLPFMGASAKGIVHFGAKAVPVSDRRAWSGVRGVSVRWIPQEPARTFTPTRPLLPQMLEGISASEAVMVNLDRLLKVTGLPDREELSRRCPYELSGGMLQRAAVISAFLPRPLLVVADEPTAHLDPMRTLILGRIITSLAQHASAAVLWITHDLRIAAALSDRVIHLKKARIDADGTPLDLLDPFGENSLPLARHSARLAMPV
jgi:peptide/nickel transport system ATP-binding protein